MPGLGSLQAPQVPGLLHPAPLRAVQRFRNAHACRSRRCAQSAQPDARDRASRSVISCSSEASNGRLPAEQGGPALSQLNGDCHPAAQDNGSGGRRDSNGAIGAISLDELPAALNGSNGSPAVPRPPRLVGAYDSDSDDGDALSELDQRILGGEFTDVGSTKSKLTKPARKVLSRGFGPGEHLSRLTPGINAWRACCKCNKLICDAVLQLLHQRAAVCQFAAPVHQKHICKLAGGDGTAARHAVTLTGATFLSPWRLLTGMDAQHIESSQCVCDTSCRSGDGAAVGAAGTRLGARCRGAHARGHRWAAELGGSLRLLCCACDIPATSSSST